MDIQSSAKTAGELFNKIQQELEQQDFNEGISFLDLKNDVFLSYMIDLANVAVRKVRHEPIDGHKSVERCVRYRVILEKLRLIDKKLNYQINKLLTIPDEKQKEEETQRIDPRNLDIDLDDCDDYDDDDDDDANNDSDNDDVSDEDDDGVENDHDNDQGKLKKNKEREHAVYKPPKLKSVAYDEHKKSTSFEMNASDKESSDDERTRYEEDNFTRLPSKKRKKRKAPKKFSFKKKK